MEDYLKSLRLIAFVLMFTPLFGAAQTATPTPAKKPATAKTPAVWQHVPGTDPGDEPVITLKTPCPKPKPGAKSACRETVTRRDFETMIKAAGPAMTPAMERSFAMNLGRMIAYGNEAASMGLQNTPEGKQLLEFARMQAMAQMLGRKLRSESENVTPAEMQAYYRDNQKEFENATLERIVIPNKPAEAEKAADKKPEDKTAEDKNAADKKAEQEYADKIRARWVAGEDPEKLQKEGYERAGNSGPEPPVKIGERKLSSVPPAQASITQLKPGEISQPFVDPGGASIYKIVSKSVVPFDEAKEEIKKTLAQKRLEQMVKDLDSRTPATLNDAYFNSLQGAQSAAPATRVPAKPAPAAPPAATPAPAAAPAPTPAPPPAPPSTPTPKTEEKPK